jgi:hypothetical protein
VDAKQIDAFAQTIADARRTRKPMDVAGAIVGMTEADAYKVQFAVHDKICAGGADKVRAGRWRSPCRTSTSR